MGKLEKIEKLQKLKESGSLTEEEFKKEKEKILNNEVKDIKISFNAIIVIILIVLIVAGIGIYFYFNTRNQKVEEKEETILNSQVGTLSKRSFSEMQSKIDDTDDMQASILEYFDNDYFEIHSPEALEKYPQVFKNAKIALYSSVVKKIIKSTDEEFEALIEDGYGYGPSTYKREYLIKGKQLEERLLEGEGIYVYGRYQSIDTYQIDGSSYTIPTIIPISIVRGDDTRFNLETITTVAKYIFGNNIKVTEPDYTGSWEDNDGMRVFYEIILDNQSNANFKAFNMDKEDGHIAYNRKYNNLAYNISKSLYISADFEHFIVITKDSELKQIYIDYFNKEFNKLWGREFKSDIISTIDYNIDKLTFVVDNDLYLLDINTGENIVEPVIVGKKLKVNMIKNEIILVGDEDKDNIMKVDLQGSIIFKENANTTIEKITNVYTQMVNDKIIICLLGTKKGKNGDEAAEKYIVLNKDSIEYTTKDVDPFGYVAY